MNAAIVHSVLEALLSLIAVFATVVCYRSLSVLLRGMLAERRRPKKRKSFFSGYYTLKSKERITDGLRR